MDESSIARLQNGPKRWNKKTEDSKQGTNDVGRLASKSGDKGDSELSSRTRNSRDQENEQMMKILREKSLGWREFSNYLLGSEWLWSAHLCQTTSSNQHFSQVRRTDPIAKIQISKVWLLQVDDKIQNSYFVGNKKIKLSQGSKILVTESFVSLLFSTEIFFS